MNIVWRFFVAALLVVFCTPLAADAVDPHALFDKVLKAHVQSGVVDYPAIAADQRFTQYVGQLAASSSPEGSREEVLAFWINAYNALAIKGILDGHSPKGLLGRLKFFKRIDYQVGGQFINLFDLEREIIIPMGESRIHFAIVCASQSCPPLRSEAFVPNRLNEQLDDQAQRFLNDSTKNRYNPSKSRIEVSKIFDWYEDEFESAAGSVQEYILPFIDDPEFREALAEPKQPLRYLKYDWSLNGIAPSAKSKR